MTLRVTPVCRGGGQAGGVMQRSRQRLTTADEGARTLATAGCDRERLLRVEALGVLERALPRRGTHGQTVWLTASDEGMSTQPRLGDPSVLSQRPDERATATHEPGRAGGASTEKDRSQQASAST